MCFLRTKAHVMRVFPRGLNNETAMNLRFLGKNLFVDAMMSMVTHTVSQMIRQTSNCSHPKQVF